MKPRKPKTLYSEYMRGDIMTKEERQEVIAEIMFYLTELGFVSESATESKTTNTTKSS